MWFADSACIIDDTPEKLQTSCRASVEVAAKHRVPFSSDCLETLRGETSHISLADGRAFANRARARVLGVTVDKEIATPLRHGGGGILARRRGVDPFHRVAASAHCLGGNMVEGYDPLQRLSRRPMAHVEAGGCLHRPDPRRERCFFVVHVWMGHLAKAPANDSAAPPKGGLNWKPPLG